jgi:hypothetical protein
MSDTCTICECVRPKNESPGAAELHLEENRSVTLSEILVNFFSRWDRYCGFALRRI